MVASNSREQFVRTAARLFAERGYAATSVADIQTALGMRAGSGALYKHFRSKRALLDEVVEAYLATMRQGRAAFLDQVPDDLEDALRFVVDVVWTSMRQSADMLRVLLRDLDAFPDLREQIWHEIRANVYGVFSAWLTAQAERGTVHAEDPDATAAVLLASLDYVPILRALIGHTPGDVEPARFADAWVHHALKTLHPGA